MINKLIKQFKAKEFWVRVWYWISSRDAITEREFTKKEILPIVTALVLVTFFAVSVVIICAVLAVLLDYSQSP